MRFLSDAELDANVLYFVDEDADDGSDVDRDRPLRDALTVEWELDDSLDSDGDGDPTNDWQRFEDATEVSTVWATLGPRTVMIRVCDPMDLCITERLSIDVTERPVELPSISDFSFQEWTAWALRTGGDSAVVLALVAVILVLGWFLLRAPTEEEEDARAFGETYDIEATPDYGGVKGMDHHVPPLLRNSSRRMNVDRMTPDTSVRCGGDDLHASHLCRQLVPRPRPRHVRYGPDRNCGIRTTGLCARRAHRLRWVHLHLHHRPDLQSMGG